MADAVEELKSRGPTPDYMNSLVEMKTKDQETFGSTFPSGLDATFKDIADTDIKPADVLLRPSFCHTGMVPAETRHKGILTDSPPGTWSDYAQGILLQEAIELSKEEEPPQLIKTIDSRQECEVQLNIDHKDFFLVKDEWSKITVPSDRELQEYGRGKELVGLVAMCLVSCPWGKCKSKELREGHIKNHTATVEVNGITVKGITMFEKCFFLKGNNGHYFPLNDNGRVEIRARSKEPGKYLGVSSFLVW